MVKVGLIGAGAWAQRAYAPLFADAVGGTELCGVWSRSAGAAADLAQRYGSRACATLGKLAAQADALAFAVPPSAQAALAIETATAHKPMLLEKPLAGTLPEAQALVETLEREGVPSMMGLAYRFAPGVKDFLARLPALDVIGMEARFLSDAFVHGPFAAGWRRAAGGFADVGPHLLDLLDLGLRPIESVQAAGGDDWTSVCCEHAGGAHSAVVVSCTVAVGRLRIELDAYGRSGVASLNVGRALGPVFADPRAAPEDAAASVPLRHLRESLVRLVHGEADALRADAHRGLYLQEVVEAVGRSVRGGSRERVAAPPRLADRV